MKFMSAVVFAVAVLVSQPGLAQTKPAAKPASSDMEILRQKIKADKKLIVAANMQLSEAEAKSFWPVYDAYQKDLDGINGRTVKLIMEYANAYNKGSVPNEAAKKLADESLAIEEAELKLKRATFAKVDKAIGAMKAARYLQIENKIRSVIKFDLASEIPLVQ